MNIEITLERSEILCRNLIRSAIATLCWQRQIFPDICFEDKVMAGLTVKRFRSIESFSLTPYHPLQLSNRVRAWIEDGAFDALRKRYLDSIIFGICYTNKEEFNGLIETYTIKIDYNDTSFDNSFLCSSSQIDNPSFSNDGLFLSSQNPPSYSQSSLYSPNPSCSQSSLFTQSQSSQSSSQSGSSHLCTIPCVRVASYETVKAATVQMLRSVTACTQAMKRNPLPQQCCVTMKLLYKDSVTPPNYQPKHFMPLSIKNNNFLFSSFDEFECDESPMGVVETDYHSVRVSIETSKVKMCVNNNNNNNNNCRKVCCDNCCDDLVYSSEETAVLLDKRDRILFAMDVLNDLPRDKRTRKITRVELRDIMGMNSAEVSELLFALTDLRSLRGTYSAKKNVFELSAPKNTYWTSNPDEITLPILKEIFNKYEKRFINNNGCNECNRNDLFTSIKKRKARDIEIPILKTKVKYI